MVPEHVLETRGALNFRLQGQCPTIFVTILHIILLIPVLSFALFTAILEFIWIDQNRGKVNGK